jgi:ubiquinone biosynthesis protein
VVEYFYQKLLEEVKLESMSLSEIKLDPRKGLENLADLRKMNVGLKELSETFHVPKEWIFLERTTLLLLGLCTHLDPSMNPMEIIRPYLEEFVFGKEKDWQKAVLPAARDLGLSLIMLPAEIRRFMQRLTRGDLPLPISGLDEPARLLYAGVHQLIYAGLGVACYSFAQSAKLRGDRQEAEWLTYAAGGLVALLLLSMFSNRKQG